MRKMIIVSEETACKLNQIRSMIFLSKRIYLRTYDDIINYMISVMEKDGLVMEWKSREEK